MLNNVFTKTLRDMRSALAWWAGGLFVLMLWMVTFFPAISEASAMQDYLNELPESFLLMFGINEATLITTLPGFLSLELFGFFFPALTVAFALSFGGSLISREEEEGTLDLLLSYPLPRWRVYLAKYAALVVFTALVLLACYLGFHAGGLVADVSMEGAALIDGVLSVFAITILFGTLAYALTGLRRARGLGVAVAAGLTVVTYFSHTLRELANLPAWVSKISPWFYYNGDSVLVDGLAWDHFALLIGITIGLLLLGMWGFQQRDLAT